MPAQCGLPISVAPSTAPASSTTAIGASLPSRARREIPPQVFREALAAALRREAELPESGVVEREVGVVGAPSRVAKCPLDATRGVGVVDRLHADRRSGERGPASIREARVEARALRARRERRPDRPAQGLVQAP